MTREDLDELHYITPIANVASILSDGILSHQRAGKVRHESVAMGEVQERRKKVMVPGGRRLHEYVNLYIHGRNPMLFVRRGQHEQLCVLRISPAVLDLRGVVIADRNASSDHVRFGPAPAALALVDRDRVFAEYWTHPMIRLRSGYTSRLNAQRFWCPTKSVQSLSQERWCLAWRARMPC